MNCSTSSDFDSKPQQTAESTHENPNHAARVDVDINSKPLREWGRWQGPTVAAAFKNKELTIKPHCLCGTTTDVWHVHTGTPSWRCCRADCRVTHQARRQHWHRRRVIPSQTWKSLIKPSDSRFETSFVFDSVRFNHQRFVLPSLLALVQKTSYCMKTHLKPVRFSLAAHHSHYIL